MAVNIAYFFAHFRKKEGFVKLYHIKQAPRSACGTGGRKYYMMLFVCKNSICISIDHFCFLLFLSERIINPKLPKRDITRQKGFKKKLENPMAKTKYIKFTKG